MEREGDSKEQDNAKKMEEELEKKAKRMQEIKEGKKEMEEDNAKEMEEELERKVEEEEWEWDGEGQEVGLIKNQEADNNSNIIKKKSFVSKLVSKYSRKEKPKVDDNNPLKERLIKSEMQRELRWQARRILGNRHNASGAFEKVRAALHNLKITNIKDLEPQHYVLEQPSWTTMLEPSVSLAELQNEFRTHVTRILSEEGGTDLNAYEHAFNLLPSIKNLQFFKRLEEKCGYHQDSMPALCSICQSPITEDGPDPFADGIGLPVLDTYAKDFHRSCLDSWLQQPQPTYLPRVENDPQYRNIIILKLIDSWENRLKIYDTRKRQDIKVMAEFKGFLVRDHEVIPALLHFLVTTATSLNVEVQDDILTVVLHALSDLYYNKIKIGDLGAIRHLAKLLEESHREAKKAAALAIVSLCVAQENHQKALEANMVDMAARLIVQEIVVEESLMTLWLLRNSRQAMTALASHEMVEQCLFIVLRNPNNPIQPESIEVTCHALIQRDQGYYQICRNIIAVFRKSLGSTGKEWFNFIM